jgi:hypothetical protein
MWESLGLLLLYLVSGYLNKRKKDQKNREIKSDPDWDNPKGNEKNIDDLLLNLFNQKETSDVLEEQSINDEIIINQPNLEINDDQEDDELSEINHNLNKEKSFEDTIYHSKLADRKELHLGNKWKNKVSIKKRLFRSKGSLKRAFILKEILDEPVGFKK